MSLKNLDVGSTLRLLAERRIEDAMKEGKFDNLSGAGQPLDLDPMPAEENARMTWWVLRILRQNDFIPEEVRWRKLVDRLKTELAVASREDRVMTLVRQINGIIHKINTLGTNALQAPVAPLCPETQLKLFRERRLAGSTH